MRIESCWVCESNAHKIQRAQQRYETEFELADFEIADCEPFHFPGDSALPGWEAKIQPLFGQFSLYLCESNHAGSVKAMPTSMIWLPIQRAQQRYETEFELADFEIADCEPFHFPGDIQPLFGQFSLYLCESNHAGSVKAMPTSMTIHCGSQNCPKSGWILASHPTSSAEI
jgi:hypothetical protein